MDFAALIKNNLLKILVGVLVIWTIKIVFSAKGEKKKYHPFGGTIFHLLLNFNNLYDYLTDLTRKNLTFRIVYHDNTEIFSSDPANIEYFLKTNFANYGKGSIHHDILEGLLGDGIFTVDGEKWRHQRKMSSYEFSTRNLREFSSGVFKTNAAKLAQMVAAAAASNQTIEIQDFFMKSAMDSVFKVVLDFQGFQEKKPVVYQEGKGKGLKSTPAQVKKRKEDLKLLKPMYGRAAQESNISNKPSNEEAESGEQDDHDEGDHRDDRGHVKKRKTTSGGASEMPRTDLIDLELVIKSFNSAATNISDRMDEIASSLKNLVDQVRKLADALTAFVSQGTSAGLEEKQVYNRALLKVAEQVRTGIDVPKSADSKDEVEIVSEMGIGDQKYTNAKVRKICEKPGELKQQQRKEIMNYLRSALICSGRSGMAEHVNINIFEKPKDLQRLLDLLNR